MSRGGWRWGAGRPGWKAPAELSQALDVRRLHRSGRLRSGYVGEVRWINTPRGDLAGSALLISSGNSLHINEALAGKPHSQIIDIVRTSCHFGGSRPWLHIPVVRERGFQRIVNADSKGT